MLSKIDQVVVQVVVTKEDTERTVATNAPTIEAILFHFLFSKSYQVFPSFVSVDATGTFSCHCWYHRVPSFVRNTQLPRCDLTEE